MRKTFVAFSTAPAVKPIEQSRVVQRQSDNGMSSAIGSAAGVGAFMIADALLNDKQQPAQSTQPEQVIQSAAQPVQLPIAPLNESNTGLWFLALVALLIGIVVLIGRSLQKR